VCQRERERERGRKREREREEYVCIYIDLHTYIFLKNVGKPGCSCNSSKREERAKLNLYTAIN